MESKISHLIYFKMNNKLQLNCVEPNQILLKERIIEFIVLYQLSKYKDKAEVKNFFSYK